MKKLMLRITLSVAIINMLFFGCTQTSQKRQKDTKLKVLATTGMIYDAVLNIAKDSVEADALMGPGVDPHLYKATQGDLQRLSAANVVFYNGLHLEGKMGEVLEKLGRLKPVVAVSEEIPKEKLRDTPVFAGNYDPHIWFNVDLWKNAVLEVGKTLKEKDPANAAYYQKNLEVYLKKLDSLHSWVTSEIATIPETQRILVTAHDAFGYFGDAYNIEVNGLQGISTQSEFGLKDVADLVNLIVDRNVKAVFVETSVSERAINAVVDGCRQRGHQVVIGGKLYSDAMGEFGTQDGTYIGMVTANVNTIVSSLK
ncbi:metal ABC transporter solute-binding protein, Zn/Mn family [Imperialibacter sp. 75]|uniref:metal ABC transporter solute-binding protein, Zn/Mn family n=2 Tax=Imperialibacter TaxID=1649461 RepID=UPI00125F1AFF|nr:zinc ABC transporter substrate-binding protein [Imperialibacter sp. 75]